MLEVYVISIKLAKPYKTTFKVYYALINNTRNSQFKIEKLCTNAKFAEKPFLTEENLLNVLIVLVELISGIKLILPMILNGVKAW